MEDLNIKSNIQKMYNDKPNLTIKTEGILEVISNLYNDVLGIGAKLDKFAMLSDKECLEIFEKENLEFIEQLWIFSHLLGNKTMANRMDIVFNKMKREKTLDVLEAINDGVLGDYLSTLGSGDFTTLIRTLKLEISEGKLKPEQVRINEFLIETLEDTLKNTIKNSLEEQKTI